MLPSVFNLSAMVFEINRKIPINYAVLTIFQPQRERRAIGIKFHRNDFYSTTNTIRGSSKKNSKIRTTHVYYTPPHTRRIQ